MFVGGESPDHVPAHGGWQHQVVEESHEAEMITLPEGHANVLNLKNPLETNGLNSEAHEIRGNRGGKGRRGGTRFCRGCG